MTDKPLTEKDIVEVFIRLPAKAPVRSVDINKVQSAKRLLKQKFAEFYINEEPEIAKGQKQMVEEMIDACFQIDDDKKGVR